MVGTSRRDRNSAGTSCRTSKLKAISELNSQNRQRSPSPHLSTSAPKRRKLNNNANAQTHKTNLSLAKSVEASYIDSIRLYHYLARHEKTAGPVFLRRNLSYVQPSSKVAKLNRKRLEKMVHKLKRDHERRTESEDPKEMPKHFRIRCVRSQILTGDYCAKIFVGLSKLSPNYKPVLANLMPDGVKASVNLPGDSKVHLPAKAFTPLNGHKQWVCRLWFHVILSKAVSPSGRGGKDLRAVPQRQAMRANAVGKETRQKSASPVKGGNVETLVFFGQKLIADGENTEITSSLNGRVNVQLISVPDCPNTLSNVVDMLEGHPDRIKTLQNRASKTSNPALELDFGSEDEEVTESEGSSSRTSSPPVSTCDIPNKLYYLIRTGGRQCLPSLADSPSHCPFCSRNFGRFRLLLLHLRFTHHRFNFALQNTMGQSIIVVSVNEQFRTDFAMEARRPFQDQPIPFPHSSFSFTEALLCKRDRAALELGDTMMNCPDLLHYNAPHRVVVDTSHRQSTSAKVSVETSPTVHLRQYFHAHSKVRSQPGEDEDSEAEPDPEWAIEDMHRNLYDFTDLNHGEKLLMDAWNKHVMQHQCQLIADKQLEDLTLLFINNHRQLLSSDALKDNMLVHLSSLTTAGALSSQAALTLAKSMHKP